MATARSEHFARGGLVLAIVAVYWPVLGGAYLADDLPLVVHNGALQRSDLSALLAAPLPGLGDRYWRPLTMLVLWGGHHLGGAFAVHLLALLLHCGNALQVRALAERAVGPARAGGVALVFALHPLQVESVAWAAAINDPLWVFAALRALAVGLRWRDRGGRGLPWAAAGWLLLAMLAKEPAVVAGPLLLVTLRALPGPPLATPRGTRAALAVAASTAIYGLLRLAVLAPAPAGPAAAPLLAAATAWHLPLAVLGRHLALLAAPLPSSPFRGLPDPAFAFGGAAVLLALALAAARRRPPRGAVLGVALLLLPLLPVLVHLPAIGLHLVNDRYLYLPLAGALLLLAGSAAWQRRAVPVLLAAVAAPLAFAQTWVWRDDAALVDHALQQGIADPTLWTMAGDSALARARAGDAAAWPRARACYAQAVATTPAATGGRVWRTRSAGLLGLAYCDLQQPAAAARPRADLLLGFHRALEAGPGNTAAWVGLGIAHASLGERTDALSAFDTALRLDPRHPEAWTNRGRLLLETGDVAGARLCLQRALLCQPGHRDAVGLLAAAERAPRLPGW